VEHNYRLSLLMLGEQGQFLGPVYHKSKNKKAVLGRRPAFFEYPLSIQRINIARIYRYTASRRRYNLSFEFYLWELKVIINSRIKVNFQKNGVHIGAVINIKLIVPAFWKDLSGIPG